MWIVITNPFTFINMKLSDKFENAIFRHEVGRNEKEETKQQCAEIAEKFAIGFFVWINNSYWIQSSNDLWYFQSDGIPEEGITIEELLEIYKKTL